MRNKTTGYGRTFRWSKRISEGAVTYRLFRKDHMGYWQPKKLVFSVNMHRSEIAHLLRSTHHQLRERVDAMQLAEWELI